MASAQEYAGIAQGAAQFGRWLDEKPERDARRKEAEARAELAQTRLEEYRATSNQRVSQTQSNLDLQTEQNMASTRQLQGDRLSRLTVDALNNYQDDGDVRHLNRLVTEGKANPVGQSVYGDIAKISPIDDSNETKAALRAQGIADVEGLLQSDKRNQFFVMNKTDGTSLVMPVTNFQKATGYSKHVSNERVAKSIKAAQDLIQLRSGLNVATIDENDQIVDDLATSYDLPRGTVYGALQKEDRVNMSFTERKAAALRDQYPDASEADILALADTNSPVAQYVREKKLQGDTRDPLELTKEYYQASQADKRTASQKESDTVLDAEDAIDTVAGGDYLALTQEQIEALPAKDRRAIRREIKRMEQVGGLSLSTDTIEAFKAASNVAILGPKAASELKESDVGPVDNLLAPLKQRFTELTPGTEGRQAFNSLANLMRNAMFGATLTQGELQAWQDQYGHLGMSLSNALTYLRGTLQTASDQLDNVSSLDSEYLVKYYTGGVASDIQKGIDIIDDRLAQFEEYVPTAEERQPTLSDAPPQVQTMDQAEERTITFQELDSFYNE